MSDWAELRQQYSVHPLLRRELIPVCLCVLVELVQELLRGQVRPGGRDIIALKVGFKDGLQVAFQSLQRGDGISVLRMGSNYALKAV